MIPNMCQSLSKPSFLGGVEWDYIRKLICTEFCLAIEPFQICPGLLKSAFSCLQSSGQIIRDHPPNGGLEDHISFKRRVSKGVGGYMSNIVLVVLPSPTWQWKITP